MKNSKSFLISAFCFLLLGTFVYGQNPNCYRITFSDKNDSPYSIDRPEEFLSDRAIAKRERFNIPVIEQDLPVNPHYIDSILNFSSEPAQIIAFSKWNNSVVIFYPETEDCHDIIDAMLNHFSFVIDTLPVAYYQLPIISPIPLSIPQSFNPSVLQSVNLSSSCDYDYGKSIDNIKLHKGELLHKAGFCGENMLICVLDAGWDNFNTISYFQPLYENGQIWGTRDLIPEVNNVYTADGHGTFTTSIMISTVEKKMIGTAPKANYYFIRSENPFDEQLAEEDFWVQAAEIADSLGADVISSSVGYTTFDYAWQNIYTPADNNGMTSIASRAATILVQKGVILVQSAGNYGASDWYYIARPADALNILAVGMVYLNGIAVATSSHGPSSDGRVKPDVAALGIDVWCIGKDGNIHGTGSGTSAAAPIIAGLSACLWQALPHYSSLEIMQLIREYGNCFNNPNTIQGYGIPNYYQCYLDHANSVPEKVVSEIAVYPNPTTGELQVTSYVLQVTSVEVFDIYGRAVSTHYSLLTTHYSIDISHLPAGIYFVKVVTKQGEIVKKVVKQYRF
ncbi:MAG: S8 family peptidase [Bacteroidales bacterium]|jgi:hypothetical protein|nr:S8 family peptidase [Bacteroidales bacterium]